MTSNICFASKPERFDIDIAHKILKLDGILSEEKQKLKNYIKLAYNGNSVDVHYNFGKGWVQDALGRVFAHKGLGMQMMWHETRNAIAGKYYEDVDIHNAHPVLLLQECTKHGWPCANLTHYVQFREATLNTIQQHYSCHRDDAKKLMIRTLYLGYQQNWAESTNLITCSALPFITDLQAEMEVIARYVANFSQHIFKLAGKGGRPVTNHKQLSRTLAVFLQTIEHQILMCMDGFFSSSGWVVGPWMFDGCGVEKQNNWTESVPDTILRACEVQIKTSLGYDVTLAKKPMLHSLQLDLSSTVDDRIIVGSSVTVDDQFAAQAFAQLMKGHIVYTKGELYVFDLDTGRWSADKVLVEKHVTIHRKKLIFYQASAVKTDSYVCFNYGGFVKNISSMLRIVQVHCIDENFFERTADSAMGKLLFLDGIYDFKTDIFTAGFDPSIVFVHRIERPFPKIRDENVISYVKKCIFTDTFSEADRLVSDYLRIGIARAIFGEFEAKVIYFCVGSANAGKGLLTDSLQAAFGGFVGIFNSNVLVHNERDGSDAAKKLAWVVDIKNKRLVIANELPMNKSLDANIIKSISSGGDGMMARTNFQDATTIINRSTLMCFSNDVPSINPYEKGVENRLRFIEYMKTFVDPNNFKGEITDEIVFADSTLKTKFKNDAKYKDSMVHLIMESYKEYLLAGHTVPLGVTQATSEWAGDVASVKGLLFEDFEITLNMEDVLPSKTIFNYLTETKKLCMSSNKVGKELTALKLVRRKAYIDGSTCAAWLGIRFRVAQDEDD